MSHLPAYIVYSVGAQPSFANLQVAHGHGEEVGGEARRVDDVELQLVDLLVDASNELEDEVNQLFLVVDKQVLSANQEREVVAFVRRLLSEDLESVGTESHEALKHARQQVLDLFAFLDHYADAHRVDRSLDLTHFLITLHDEDRLAEERLIVLEFDLGVHLALDQLRREVAQVEAGLQVEPDIAQIVLLGPCHLSFLSL